MNHIITSLLVGIQKAPRDISQFLDLPCCWYFLAAESAICLNSRRTWLSIYCFWVLQLFEFEFRECLIDAVLFTTGTQIEIWTDLVEPMQHTRYGPCVKIISVGDSVWETAVCQVIPQEKVQKQVCFSRQKAPCMFGQELCCIGAFKVFYDPKT